MLTLHQALIRFRNALGYKENNDGVCALYAEMAIDAFLINDMKSFYQHCAYIQKNIEQPDFFNCAKKAKNLNSSLTETISQEESENLPALLDAIAFIESGELYLSAGLYHEMFGRPLSEGQKKEISVVAQSKKLEKSGGRALAHSFVGIYTSKELEDYIALFKQLALDAQQDFAVSLGSSNHAISLCYSYDTNTWQLVNANQPSLPPISTDANNFKQQLAKQIQTAFKDNMISAFQTHIWTTGERKDSFQRHVDTFSQNRNYDIASHAYLITARNVSLAFIAAQNGDTKALAILIDAKNPDGSFALDLDIPIQDG